MMKFAAKCKQKIRENANRKLELPTLCIWRFCSGQAASVSQWVVGFGKNYKFPANLLVGADTWDYRGGWIWTMWIRSVHTHHYPTVMTNTNTEIKTGTDNSTSALSFAPFLMMVKFILDVNFSSDNILISLCNEAFCHVCTMYRWLYMLPRKTLCMLFWAQTGQQGVVLRYNFTSISTPFPHI